MEIEDNENIRLNIILPKEILTKIDLFKNNAGLASRGRTIQALVDTVWNIQLNSRDITHDINNRSSEEEFFYKIIPNLINILKYTSMFEIKS